MNVRLDRRACAAVLVSLLLTGCATAHSTGSGTESSAQPTTVASTTPSISWGSGDSVEATGYVAFSRLEGGFWALYDRLLAGPSAATQPKIIAILLPGAIAKTAISALKGTRVHVTGRLHAGVSARQAGPEVLVDTIAGVTSDVPR